MSPTSSSISTPVSVAIASTSGAACSPSPPLPGPTSTPRMISVDSSSTTCSLCPSKRREADLRPWRISGSVLDTMRSLATPRRDAGLAGSGVDLDVLGHEGGQELRRLPAVLPVFDGLEQLVGSSDHVGELQG